MCYIWASLLISLSNIERGGKKHSGVNTFDLWLGKTQEETMDAYLLSTSYYTKILGLNTQYRLGR